MVVYTELEENGFPESSIDFSLLRKWELWWRSRSGLETLLPQVSLCLPRPYPTYRPQPEDCRAPACKNIFWLGRLTNSPGATSRFFLLQKIFASPTKTCILHLPPSLCQLCCASRGTNPLIHFERGFRHRINEPYIPPFRVSLHSVISSVLSSFQRAIIWFHRANPTAHSLSSVLYRETAVFASLTFSTRSQYSRQPKHNMSSYGGGGYSSRGGGGGYSGGYDRNGGGGGGYS
jgi:hypothetical protein